MEKLAQLALEFLKLAPRYMAAIAAVSAALLFGSDEFLKRLGLFDLQQRYRGGIGLALLISGSLLAVDGATKCIAWARRVMRRRSFAKFRKQQLLSLTEGEKQILRFYVAQQTKTNVLRYDDGVVQGLVAKGIIHQASSMGNVLEGFAYNIDDSVWAYLNENREVLAGTTNTYRTDKRYGHW
jgi:hypothetical protein